MATKKRLKKLKIRLSGRLWERLLLSPPMPLVFLSCLGWKKALLKELAPAQRLRLAILINLISQVDTLFMKKFFKQILASIYLIIFLSFPILVLADSAPTNNLKNVGQGGP